MTGELSAQATWRAKWWLGYPRRGQPLVGQTLYELLTGALKLNEDNLRRRKSRLAAVAKTVGQKALDVAITQIGTQESPRGSNLQKYGSWYSMNGVPWCAIFDSWCFAQSGYTRFRYSYVPAVHDDARNVRNHLCIIRTPRPGDLVLYNWSGSVDAHIEFFEKWEQEGSTFSAVGGNTGGNFANGGEVLRQTRYMGNVNVFVRAS